MKKLMALLMVLVLTLTAAAALADDAKLGLGVVTGFGHYDADATADKDGKTEVDTTIATVLVDAEGKIVDVKIDVAQTPVTFNAQGVRTTDYEATQMTKMEKKELYAMKAASPIGKEFNEQIEGLQAWLIGKTVAEFKAAVDAKDETLYAVCTVTMTDFVAAVEKAVAAATAM